jgi:hypothetical protein
MKGIFNSNPPKLKDYNTRDANIVLEDFRTVSSKELCLLPLACKLVTLLSMDTMLRFSELTSIDRKSVIFSDNSVNFSQTGSLRSMSVRKLHDQSIDPVHCRGLYVHSTDTLRIGFNEHRRLIGSVNHINPLVGRR